jgi:hypothetical protein
MARFNDNPSFENTKIVRKQHKAKCQYMQLAEIWVTKIFGSTLYCNPNYDILVTTPNSKCPTGTTISYYCYDDQHSKIKDPLEIMNKGLPPHATQLPIQNVWEGSIVFVIFNPRRFCIFLTHKLSTTFSTLTIPNPHTSNI